MNESASGFAGALAALTRADVEFVVVGAGGLNFYARDPGEAIATLDLDLLLAPDPENLGRALGALAAEEFAFGAAGEPFLDREAPAALANAVGQGACVTATRPDGTRLDLMLSIRGFSYAELAEDAQTFTVEGAPVRVGRAEKLLRSKELAGRPKDEETLRQLAARGEPDLAPRTFTLTQKLAAWGVHLFTASGAIVAVLALMAIARGSFKSAAIWMLLALVIDSVDGTLARAARVKEVLPDFNGRRLDDMVDFLNYVVVAVVFLGASGHLPSLLWGAIPVLASAYGFSHEHAKTPDNFFLGFPSYWNVVAIYAWLLDVAPWTTLAWVAGFAALVFVPLKYIYPSQSPVLRRETTIGAAVFVAALALACLAHPSALATALAWLTLLFPAWYFGVSLWKGGLHRA